MGVDPTDVTGGKGELIDTDVTTEQLYNEFSGVRLAPDQRAEVLLDGVTDALSEGDFRFAEGMVKSNLEEILLLLVAGREADAHGKGLMGDLATVFDTRLSPGTVYPRLHDLESDGLLSVQELVRTKEYRIEDDSGVAERVEAAMEQHLALGLFFRAALADFDD